jgi:hypothetical protein
MHDNDKSLQPPTSNIFPLSTFNYPKLFSFLCCRYISKQLSFPLGIGTIIFYFGWIRNSSIISSHQYKIMESPKLLCEHYGLTPWYHGFFITGKSFVLLLWQKQYLIIIPQWNRDTNFLFQSLFKAGREVSTIVWKKTKDKNRKGNDGMPWPILV